MTGQSTSSQNPQPVSAQVRRKVVALAAPRFGAWLVDAALYALFVFALFKIDGVILDGALGINVQFEVEEVLLEEEEVQLEDDVVKLLQTYEQTRNYANGAQEVFLRFYERRSGVQPGGEPWDIEVSRYELVSGDPNRPGRFFGFATLAFLVMLPLGYRYFLESSSWQASLGMRLFGLKVTDWNLKRPSQWDVLKRNLFRYVSVAIIGIGYLMALFTENKQTLHDKLAGTLVVSQKELARVEWS